MRTGLLPTLSENIPAGIEKAAADSILAERIVPRTVSLKPRDNM